MEQVPDGVDELARLRNALFDVCYKAGTLAERVERMESVYAGVEDPLNTSYFYVPSTIQTGRAIDEPLQEDQLRPSEQRARKAAIEAVLALRAAVDCAIELVGSMADLLDNPHESFERRWTIRTIEQLRLLRGTILIDHHPDAYPSALPMVRVGVPNALRDTSKLVWKRIEEVKSAIFAGMGSTLRPPIAPPTEPLERVADRVGTETVEAMCTGKGESTIGKCVVWKDVQRKLLVYAQRKPFSSLRLLAAEFKCSDSTIRKAINNSNTLKGWKKRHTIPMAAPRAKDLSAVVKDNIPQITERAPDDYLPNDDVDIAMDRLIQQARPEEQVKLNDLNNDERRELAAQYYAQNLDEEPSSVEPDMPSGSPRKVKQHRRV